MPSAGEGTTQGKAIASAAFVFGGGGTTGVGGIAFTVCKRKFRPWKPLEQQQGGQEGNVVMKRAYACHLHEDARRKRMDKEGGHLRDYELFLKEIWREEEEREGGEEGGKKKKKCKVKA